jgi:DNA replication protein DnaC
MAALKIALERWSERPKGWIILEGPYGCGKTHLAYACANKMLDLKMGVHIASMPDLLKTLKDGIGDDKNDLSSRLDLMAQCSVLIIDDLGVEKATEWSRESIFLIFNTRYHNRLPMLITTNEPLDSPNSNIDPRIRSRLSEGANTKNSFCRYNKIECEDYRPFKEEE